MARLRLQSLSGPVLEESVPENFYNLVADRMADALKNQAWHMIGDMDYVGLNLEGCWASDEEFCPWLNLTSSLLLRRLTSALNTRSLFDLKHRSSSFLVVCMNLVSNCYKSENTGTCYPTRVARDRAGSLLSGPGYSPST